MCERNFGREEESGGRHWGWRGHCGEKHFRGRHGEWGEHFGGGRFRGRFFETGDLRFVMLRLIAEKPRYGYELIKAIEEKLGGSYAPSPGVIYPTLTLLEELGYVTVSTTEGAKKLYTITAEGLSALEANRPAVDALFERMEKTGAAAGRGQSPQIIRAVQNFHLALRLKMSQGQLSEEQVRKIADVIDAAAKSIEQN